MNSNSRFILGISAHYHDSAAALVSADGEIIAAAHESRFTRIKHDNSFPKNAINYCMGLARGKIDAVAYYEKPILKFERVLEVQFANVPRSLLSFVHSMSSQIAKLRVKKEIRKAVGKDIPVYFTRHHEAHAASAFFPSPFDSSAFLCMDGVGEWDSTSFGVCSGNKIEFLGRAEFPHSLGLLYSAFTGYLGFKVDSGEYKLMGLAPYGTPKYADLILKHIVDVKDDGSFWLNQNYFNYCWGNRMYSRAFDELFHRRPRRPESLITEDDMDLAASIQHVIEEIILKIARHVKKLTNAKNLVMSGGVALNCVANGRLLKSGIFDNIWIQPASGDAGGALGAALAIAGCKVSQKGSFLGPKYSRDEVRESLKKYKAVFSEYSVKTIAKMITDGKIVARFSGRAEFGPRALGNRSILADPRNPYMQKKLNHAVKKRESFRPFAPACLEEDASLLFDIDVPSPYMLFTAKVKDNVNLPAITHVDKSARVQTVSIDENPGFWKIINEFKKITGIGALVNTSFNIRGEPIVESIDDAYRCFMYADIDALIIEDMLLLKENQLEIDGLEKYFSSLKSD